MKLYEVTTIVQFKHTYFVEAEEESHALDEVVMREGADMDSSRWFEEASQEYLGETVLGSRESSVKDFVRFLDKAREDKNINCSHWMGTKLIHSIDYNEQPQQSTRSQAFDTMVNTLTSLNPTNTITVSPLTSVRYNYNP